jgi:PKHD-type hydroxylase
LHRYRESPDVSEEDNTITYAIWEKAFSPAELDAIERLGDRLAGERATLAGSEPQGTVDDKVRVTHRAWIPENAESKWFYDRMQTVVRTLNERVYQFALDGLSEDFQYAVYHGAEGGHYDWHVDQGPLTVRRKLSITLQLTDPSHYEGCDLQFFAYRMIESAPRERGTVIAFPAYVVHRVTPCTRGTRKSVVVWTTGPKFK